MHIIYAQLETRFQNLLHAVPGIPLLLLESLCCQLGISN